MSETLFGIDSSSPRATMHVMSRRAKDLSGLQFGELTVVAIGRRGPKNRQYWKCVCRCGGTKETLGRSLVAGKAKSCGCLAVRRMKEEKPALRHGHRSSAHQSTAERSLTYRSWLQMKRRCENRRNPAFNRYGGRGIAICSAWSDSFEAFLADMGERPSAEHSVDRIDVNGDYAPGNVRWATAKQQARNRRTTKLTTDSASSIRTRAAAGDALALIAQDLGVSERTVDDVIQGRRWAP